jgi:hypothetical protein
VIDPNDKEGLKVLSQHPIQNAFYEGICLGGNTRGIHGLSPGCEPLHVLELGLFKMMIKGFYVNLGYKPGSKSYTKILQLPCVTRDMEIEQRVYSFDCICLLHLHPIFTKEGLLIKPIAGVFKNYVNHTSNL